MSDARPGTGPNAGPDGGPDAPLAAELRGYLDHLAVERGVARNTMLSYRRDLHRYLLIPGRARPAVRGRGRRR